MYFSCLTCASCITGHASFLPAFSCWSRSHQHLGLDDHERARKPGEPLLFVKGVFWCGSGCRAAWNMPGTCFGLNCDFLIWIKLEPTAALFVKGCLPRACEAGVSWHCSLATFHSQLLIALVLVLEFLSVYFLKLGTSLSSLFLPHPQAWGHIAAYSNTSLS